MLYMVSIIFAAIGFGLLWWSQKARSRSLKRSQIGVRTKATLASKTTWKESHAQAWFFTVAMGVIALLMAGMLAFLQTAHIRTGDVVSLIVFGLILLGILAMITFVVTNNIARNIKR